MEYIRQIVNNNSLPPIFNLPKTMQDRRVEVIILPLEDNDVKKIKSFRGLLNQYVNT